MDTLPRRFYARDPRDVARTLLGHHLVNVDSYGDRATVRIVETEAYHGPEDPASHARHGRASQAKRMWEDPGRSYVYVCYGIHQMMNVVAHEQPEGVGAILIRAGEPVDGFETMQARRGEVGPDDVASGPGNLTEALAIHRDRHDGVDVTTPTGLRIEEGRPPGPSDISRTPRIGISEGTDRLLRFVDASSGSLSRPGP